MEKCWNIDWEPFTELQIYEISDPVSPELLGKARQDGNYKTSRKIGDIVYLFTDQNMIMPGLTKEEAGKPENAGSWIPLVNDVSVPAECIYIPEKGNQALVISSTDIKKPGQIVDRSVIMNNNVDIYVSGESLFVYSMDYQTPIVKTRIAKFSLKEGMINAVDAVSVDGEIRDTFAMDESDGKLRLLTTVWNGTDYENNLYLFDKKMQLTFGEKISWLE